MYNISIQNMKKVDKPKLRASFTLVLDNCLEIFNCKLIYSDKTNQFYAFCPTYKYGDRYYNLVRFSSPLHQQVLDAVLIAYSQL